MKKRLTTPTVRGKGKGKGGVGGAAPDLGSSEATRQLLDKVAERLWFTNRYLSILAHNSRLMVQVASSLAAPKSHPKGDAPSTLPLFNLETLENHEVTRPVYAAADGREEGDIPTCDADLAAHLFGDSDEKTA